MSKWRYATPLFSAGDPLICHTIRLRPLLWAVLFNELQRLSSPYRWRQDEATHATESAVATEFDTATESAVFSGCIMIGQILELALDTAPGWLLLCDGTTYARADYPDLYAVIHANLKIDADNFRVPDRDNRLGMGGQPVGDQGGEAAHTLTVAELPSHHHSITDPGSVIIAGEPPLGVALADPGLPSVTGDTGGGEAHNNLPPWEGTRFYIVARYPGLGD